MNNDAHIDRLARIETKLDTALSTLVRHDDRITSNEADINKAKGGWLAILGASGLTGALAGIIANILGKNH